MTASPTITHETHSVADFIQKVRDLPTLSAGFYTYRGEANINWPIRPSIMRPEFAKLLSAERDATRDLISVHPHEFDPDTSMFDRLVRMQHFGLPTRLMDVTGNPLVALFNACADYRDSTGVSTDGQVYYIDVPPERRKYFDSDTVSCVANLANMSDIEKSSLLRLKDKGIEDFNV